jgi:hypothetical protein
MLTDEYFVLNPDWLKTINQQNSNRNLCVFSNGK